MAGTNLDFPYHFDGLGRSATAGRDDHIRDLIEQILFTAPGERVMRPDFGGGLLALDSPDWAEAIPNSTQWPSCLLSSGLLPAFLGALGGHSLGAMELECRSNGGQKCRFVIGAPDNLSTLYERLALGMRLEDAVKG